MEIVPNSTLYILKNVPLDKTYDHTIYFANKAAQEAAFIAKKKFKCGAQGELSALTYVRVNRGVIRVGIPSEQLYDCNYLMFQNKGFQQSGQNDRWFYAFIESVEYINNTTSEIRFSIDVMQTWYFDYTVEDCFVVREHSTTDVAGDNLLPENVELGEYFHSNSIDFKDDTTGTSIFSDWVICMCRTTADWASGLPVLSGIKFYGRLLTAAEFNTYEITASGLQDLRQDLGNMGLFNTDSSIISLFMTPRRFIPTPGNTPQTPVAGVCTVDRPSTLGGYTPRNKKLLTYPYIKLTVDNNEGQSIDYHYEDFLNDPSFAWSSSLYDKPAVIVRPLNYLSDIGVVDTQLSIIKSDFPSVIYATTDAGAKIVQAGMGLAIGALAGGAVTSAITTTTTAKLSEKQMGEHGRLVTTASRQLDTQEVRETTTPEMSGVDVVNKFLNFAQNMGTVRPSIGRGSNMYDCGLFKFTIRQNHIRMAYAEIIDQYFDRYGYSCRKLKRPNTHARKHWTYTQTANCTIAGSMPADDEAKICSIYNNGVTFWNNMNEVGEYTTYASDNTPL